jgi:putative phosphoesterase
MLIGIMSDSHGKVARVRAACALFEPLGVQLIVHCGDVGGQGVFDELVGRNCRYVWGNTDEPDGSLRAYLQAVGLPAPTSIPLVIEADGRTLHVYHGHEPEFARELRRPQADYILHGHTHAARDERISGARVINPGALHRAFHYTVATLDTARDQVEFHTID